MRRKLQFVPRRETMKTAYLDIETSYDGTFTDQRLFKDYNITGLRSSA